MTSADTRIEKLLAELPLAEPDAARSARVRARCFQALSRSSSARMTTRRPRRPGRLIASAMVGGFCLVYLLAVAAIALRVRGYL